MNKDILKPNKPRPAERSGSMVMPGQDLRWRGVPAKVKKIDVVRRHEKQMRAR